MPAVAQFKFAEYAIRITRSFEGREGRGFEGELWRESQRVAYVEDRGNGGALFFRWQDRDAEPVPLSDRPEVKGTPEQARLHAFVQELSPAQWDGRSLPYDPDFFVSTMAGEALEKKAWRARLSRHLKKKVVFISADQKAVKTIARPPDPELLKRVQESFPGCVILNGLSLDEAVEKSWPVCSPVSFSFKGQPRPQRRRTP